MDNFSFTPEIIDSVSNEGCSVNNSSDPALMKKQAIIFLEDADSNRQADHRIDEIGLKIYRFLFCLPWRIAITLSNIGLLLLAFFEYPSSLSISSAIDATHGVLGRLDVPYQPLFILEAIFTSVLLTNVLLESYVNGMKRSFKSPWVIVFFVAMGIYWIDYFVSLGLPPPAYVVRIRRFFRPYFAIKHSELMQEVLISICKTLKDILSVFILLVVWLLAFSIVAISVFSGYDKYIDVQYNTLYDSMFALIVLLTTCNNPDVMVLVYNTNRLYFLFYLIFVFVGIFIIMNVMLAVVYNEFKGHMVNSMQQSLLQRRIAIRAMFEVLKTVNMKSGILPDYVDHHFMKSVIACSSLAKWRKREMFLNVDSLKVEILNWNNFQRILQPMDEPKDSGHNFSLPVFKNVIMKRLQGFITSKYFDLLGLILSLVNVIIIAIVVSNPADFTDAQGRTLNIMNWVFTSLYIVEQSIKIIVMGSDTYFSKVGCVFDFAIILVIFITKTIEALLALSPDFTGRGSLIGGVVSVWDMERVTDLLIVIRAGRQTQHFPSIASFVKTLFDIPWRIKALIGILLLLFYTYALLGMILFGDVINPTFMAAYNDCGSYQQLGYGAVNFNDFYSCWLTLWCLLIVNNWHVFMIAFARACNTNWVHLYMISWWIIAVNIILKCVTAFVIEIYAQRKSYSVKELDDNKRKLFVFDTVEESIRYLHSSVVINETFTFEMLFKSDLVEPTEHELINALRGFDFFCLMYPHIKYSKFDDD